MNGLEPARCKLPVAARLTKSRFSQMLMSQVRIGGSLYFANVAYVEETLLTFIEETWRDCHGHWQIGFMGGYLRTRDPSKQLASCWFPCKMRALVLTHPHLASPDSRAALAPRT